MRTLTSSFILIRKYWLKSHERPLHSHKHCQNNTRIYSDKSFYSNIFYISYFLYSFTLCTQTCKETDIFKDNGFSYNFLHKVSNTCFFLWVQPLIKFIISIKSIMLPELICSNRHLTAYFNWYCLHLKYENPTTYIALYDIHSSPCNSNSSSNWLSFNSLKVKCAFVAYRSQIIFSKINHEHPPSTL